MSTWSQFFGGRVNKFQYFSSSGTFTPSPGLIAAGGTVQLDLRGGGGGSSFYYYAAGGSSKLLTFATALTPVTVTIGAGGIGTNTPGVGTAGGASSFGSVTCNGGGPGLFDVNGTSNAGKPGGRDGTYGSSSIYGANSSFNAPGLIGGGANGQGAGSGAGAMFGVSADGSSGSCMVSWWE